MPTNRRLLAGTLGLALLVAACGGSSTATTSPSTATSSPAPAASQAAASESVPTSVPSGPAVSLAPGQAADLEAMLPNEAGGLTFTKQSFDGASIGAAGIGMDAGELGPILTANGKTVADVRMAIATSAGTTPGQTAMVLAFQIRGVDATKFVSLVAGSSASSLVPATVGGKQVQKTGTDTMAGVIYTKGDVLFEVLLANAAAAEAIVAALP